jgi:pimeloyl-ACP methyl ester carboxylesterase
MESKKIKRTTGLIWLSFAFVVLMTTGCGQNETEGEVGTERSIFKAQAYEQKLMTIYESRLAEWPYPYESLFLDTSYGTVHVIASGPKDAPPVLLFHASELAAWSWLPNIGVLNEHYRTYAVDHIGEAGKSVLKDTDVFPKDGKSIADLYLQISDKLGVQKVDLIGASNGGYIALNYSVYAPERVKKIVLLCPMGISPPRAVMGIKMVMAQLFPKERRLDRVRLWALGEDPAVQEMSGQWFYTMMEGVIPRVALPKAVDPEHLRQIRAPVLLFLGTKDNVVGSHKKAERRANNIPDIRVEVLDTGHVPGIEQPAVVNPQILEFLRG